MRKNQSLLFCFNFDPCFPMQMAEIEERQNREKIQPSPIQICQNPGPFLYPLKKKNKITFIQFMAFLDKKNRVWSKVKGLKSKSNTAFHCAINCGLLKTQKVWPPTFYFCDHWSQRTFQKYFNPNFQVWLLFLVPQLHFRKI